MDSDFNRISPHTKGNCIGSRDRESSTDHLDSAGFKNFGSETPKELVPFSTAASLWPVLPRCDGKRLPQCCRIWYLLRIGNQIFDFFHRTYIIISIISVYQWIDVAHCPQSISFFSSTYLPTMSSPIPRAREENKHGHQTSVSAFHGQGALLAPGSPSPWLPQGLGIIAIDPQGRSPSSNAGDLELAEGVDWWR